MMTWMDKAMVRAAVRKSYAVGFEG
ncbi:MAG: hypothetical protein HW383_491, partial [Candidatus Magasanikbacteria bacterium]|nr:hypothetical protein [Candidatus Magasanikbacteria bacterium]